MHIVGDYMGGSGAIFHGISAVDIRAFNMNAIDSCEFEVDDLHVIFGGEDEIIEFDVIMDYAVSM